MFRWLFKRPERKASKWTVDPGFSGPWPIYASPQDKAASQFIVDKINGALVQFLLNWRPLEGARENPDVGFVWISGCFKGRDIVFAVTDFDDSYIVYEPNCETPSVIPKLKAALLKTGRFVQK